MSPQPTSLSSGQRIEPRAEHKPSHSSFGGTAGILDGSREGREALELVNEGVAQTDKTRHRPSHVKPDARAEVQDV